MKKFSLESKEGGFSLVELMIVVGIIGILATLALPRFKQFQAKAKMGEAKNILSHVYTLEQSYSLDNNTFAVFATLGRLADGTLNCTPLTGAVAIGFRIDPCVNANPVPPTPRYGYSVAAGTGGITTAFTATAATGALANNLICPGNALHNVTITHENVVTSPDVGTACVN